MHIVVRKKMLKPYYNLLEHEIKNFWPIKNRADLASVQDRYEVNRTLTGLKKEAHWELKEQRIKA